MRQSLRDMTAIELRERAHARLDGGVSMFLLGVMAFIAPDPTWVYVVLIVLGIVHMTASVSMFLLARRLITRSHKSPGELPVP